MASRVRQTWAAIHLAPSVTDRDWSAASNPTAAAWAASSGPNAPLSPAVANAWRRRRLAWS